MFPPLSPREIANFLPFSEPTLPLVLSPSSVSFSGPFPIGQAAPSSMSAVVSSGSSTKMGSSGGGFLRTPLFPFVGTMAIK